jgi:carbon starvation protein CstA
MQLPGLSISGTTFWKILLSAYVLVAAGAPVWMYLQSRDVINVHILWVGIIGLMVTLIVASLRSAGGVDASALPVFDAQGGGKNLGLFWLSIFITIACGAVSWFHSLCASGTTCKQLTSEAATSGQAPQSCGHRFARPQNPFMPVCFTPAGRNIESVGAGKGR